MPLCQHCGDNHLGNECPHQRKSTSIENVFKAIDPTSVNPDAEFKSIRQVLINKKTGLEDNFITPYYYESKRVAQMGRDEVESIRARHEIEVEGNNVPNPITSFREAGLAPDLVNHLDRLGFTEPTPIQMQSLPCLLSGRDVVGMAETGSGKTLCYILPMLMFLRSKPPTNPGEGPLVIILAPTRELVEQIYSETLKLMPQVALSVNATSSNPVQSLGHAQNNAAKARTASHTSTTPSASSVSDFGRRIQQQKQQLQIKQQQAQQQQQIQQAQQQHMLEIQQLQQQHIAQSAQFTPEQAQSLGIASAQQAQIAQLTAQHQAALAQMQAEHSQQYHQLIAEHAQQTLLQQQKQQLQNAIQMEPEAQDYSLYAQNSANGKYDYSQYNYETAASYYSTGQDFSYDQYYTTPAAPAVATPPPLPRKVLGVCGGVPINVQITPLQRGIDILVSTPGRLIDLMNKGVCKMDRVSYMVFDEADRMLALSMELQLRHIVTQCSICARQSVLFSATFPPAVERLVRSAVLNPIYVRVGEGNTAAQTIGQSVLFVHSVQKRHKLLEILRETEKPPVLIFANSHHTVDFLVKLLREEQFHVAGLHGEKNQPYRFRAMKAFKDGQLDILVATDVAARGIDVNDITHVIQFDLPDNMEDYIHRIGRTGRAGKMGQATAFLGLDCKIADDLKHYLKQMRQPIPAELQNTKQFGGEIVRGELRDYAVKKRL